MSSDSPESGPVEVTKSEDATPGTSEQQFPSAADLEAESSVVSRSANEPEESLTTEESRTREGITDGAVLNEVRSSLETISNGVEELANTVHDLLGLSDSDTSGDSNNDSEGSERPSWHRIMSRARGRRRSRRLLKDAIGKGQVDSANQSDSDGETSTNNREIIPEIRECNYEQFHSRPAGDSHKLHCLDILIAGDSLYKDFEKFQDIATKVKSGKIESWMPGQTDNSTSEDKDEKWIRRLRINSTAVIEMLGHLCHETSRFRGRGIIFSRPFQLLVSCHNEMKEQLTKMKGPASDVPDDTNNANDSIDPVDSSMARTLDRHSQLQKLGNKKGALDELTCFVDFMDTRIMPDALKYRLQPSTAPQTIRHEDLWYLFKPGDIVYIPRDTSSSDPFKSSLFAQPILRIIQTHLTPMSSSKCLRLNSDSGWCIVGHFIEHDGTSYAPVYIKVPQISTYRGVKKVTELPVYPISYLEDPQILAQAESDGATYVSLVERRSGYYSGWTHTTDPIGRPLAQSLSGDRLASPEHIESDILVDFQETFNAFPSWKLLTYPESSMDSMEIGMIRPTQYTIPVLEWDEAGRVRHGFYGQHVGRDTTEMLEAATFLKEDTLGQFRKDTRKAPTGRFLALLPGRFFAYAVLQRRFVRLNTRFVRSADVEANDKAFEKLEINRNYKRLVLALVKSHFDKIETEKRTNTEIGTQDLIRGKGKGVVILLHGVPGVGKTATAEAVALKWKKPLFPITCGDLGFTAETLEKSLNEIFRLAHHWGCILLLDEADVFITRRERHDLKRNALVSGKTQKLYWALSLFGQILTILKRFSGCWSTTMGLFSSQLIERVFWTRPLSRECT